jgi:hypothetical protein
MICDLLTIYSLEMQHIRGEYVFYLGASKQYSSPRTSCNTKVSVNHAACQCMFLANAFSSSKEEKNCSFVLNTDHMSTC